MTLYNGYTKPQSQTQTIENEIAAITDLLTRYPDNQYWIARLALVKKAAADLAQPVCLICNFRHAAADYCTGSGLMPAHKPQSSTATVLARDGLNNQTSAEAEQLRRDIAREYNARFTK